MVLGLVALAARLGLAVAKPASKAAVQTVPKATGWGTFAKTGIVGGSIAAGGLGVSSAIGSAQESIESRLEKIENELSRLQIHHAVVWLSEALELRLKKIEDELK